MKNNDPIPRVSSRLDLGKVFSTGSLRASLPSSIKNIMPMAVTGFVTDLMSKIVSTII